MFTVVGAHRGKITVSAERRANVKGGDEKLPREQDAAIMLGVPERAAKRGGDVSRKAIWWRIIFLFAVSFVLPAPANAEYIVTGKIRGQECTNYIVFESRTWRSIDVASGAGGRFFTLPQQYPEVSQHSEKNGRCWINIKSHLWGLISGAINPYSYVTFYEKQQDGSYEELDVEYLMFPCRKAD